ncbi:solute carrier family 23 protein [Brachybacterium saurashtrense]|uniref:Uracil-xanthine permease n=1 Tax=Brachybacterium saurashtrense TaxID=556288 RepID=A0A345YSK2_9MICO|nr:solute carrier family 23 protein [Brachybacterium saurashtrense]AXK46904.1 uracil-xanthine permease [Brachybacterium saurashtrense]RRR22619.1 uracil-xanthine permease [Brachybacterium saurashtrense]
MTAAAPAPAPQPAAAPARHPVDQVPPPARLTVLSIQHVLAFYAGAVIVPLLIASGLDLTPEQTIHLINADLFTCGIATLIQSVGFWKVGVRLPIIQGVTTTAVSPIIAIGLAATGGEGGAEGLPMIYGSIIVAGLFTFLVAPYFARILRFFPPVVIGTVLATMGITLLGVSAGDITNYAEGTPTGRDIAYALGTLAVIVLAQRFFRGFLGTIAVLLGLVLGTAVAVLLGDTDFSGVAEASAVGVTTPFYFGIPAFSLTAIVSMIIVMLITMVETTGDVFAAGEIVGRRIRPRNIAEAIRADGLSTLLGGVLNSFPYTCFAQNIGLVRLTRVQSRWVVAGAGVLMIILGLLPKAGAVVAAIPSPVLGGASLALFASVALVGIQTLSTVDLTDNRNSVIVGTSLGLAMLVSFKPDIAGVFPAWAQVFVSSGVTVGALTAIVLNLVFFHLGRQRGAHVATTAQGERIGIEEVGAMDRETFVATFGSLFNGATWPLERAWESRPFADAAALREAIEEAVLTADRAEQDALVRAYPDMATLVTATEEQAGAISQDVGSLALDGLDEEDVEALRDLSARYAERFELPFVAFLGRTDSLETILADGVRRLDHSPAHERRVALAEVAEIAGDRFGIMVADANPIGSAWARKFESLR